MSRHDDPGRRSSGQQANYGEHERSRQGGNAQQGGDEHDSHQQFAQSLSLIHI